MTLSAPDDDQVSYTLEDLTGKIKVALGGRAAEEIIYETITTGAESDIEQATAIARQMVGRWGMSDAIGLVTVLPSDGQVRPGGSDTSEATQQLIDQEIRRMIETAHRDVRDLLTVHRVQLDSLAQALLKVETLDELDAYVAAGVPNRPSPALAQLATNGRAPAGERSDGLGHPPA